MSLDISATDILRLGKIAWQLWELAFSKAKNAGSYAYARSSTESHLLYPPTTFLIIVQVGPLLTLNNLCSAKQYAEFGADIQHFARNLQKLGQVIGDVTKQVPATLSQEDHTWDLKSLLQICGDFRKTLNECQRLLEDSGKFERGRDNFIYNIRWNLSVEPQVTTLRDRVAFHNIKVTLSP